VPLIAAGVGVAGLWASFALTSDLTVFWIGVPLGLLGSTLAAIGYRRRLEEMRSTRPSTGRPYGWLFLGWACVLAGLLISPYALAKTVWSDPVGVTGLRAGASLTRFVGYRAGAACSAYPTIVGGPGVYRAYECWA
jgi:hypothetical protein